MNRVATQSRFFQSAPILFILKKSIPFFLVGLGCLPLAAQDIPAVPNPPRLVNDLAGALQPDQREALERKLVAFDDSTSTQITIVIVPTTGEYEISDYSFALGRQWGIGQRGKDNGILLTWAVNDRRYFIATGYGAEGAITDAEAGRIGEQYLRPNFRAGAYYQGLNEATDALMQQVQGEFTAADRADNPGEGSGFPVLLLILVIFVVIFVISRNNRGGGNRFGRGGPVFFPYTTFGGGGSRSGSGFGGGGGFGGFGGGSFGGGGAGGDY
ncbi:MAG: TPM domain-containing protein [Ferruginibacter sp.]|nr:TPM domain-containing protein [Cytophagales bacterium]